MEYIGIKLKGIDHFIWFEKINYNVKNNEFSGTSGWGKNGALTSATGSVNDITSQIESATLQY